MADMLKKALNGDPESFITVIEQNKPSMYRVALSILKNDADCADAMQEAILTCWQHRDKLKKPAYFKTWLIRILINKCNDIIRKNSNLSYVDSYEGIEPAVTDCCGSDVDDCIEKLSDNSKTMIELYYKRGFKVKEIALILGIKENTVKTRLMRARKEFKNIYEEGVAL